MEAVQISSFICGKNTIFIIRRISRILMKLVVFTPFLQIGISLKQPSRKMNEKIISFSFSNSIGIEPFPLLYIFTPKYPHVFVRIMNASMYLITSNKKSWVTMDIFFNWFERFSAYIYQTSNRILSYFFILFRYMDLAIALLNCPKHFYIPPVKHCIITNTDDGWRNYL